jgi:hypothetical protein
MYSYYNNKLSLRIAICCVAFLMVAISPARAVDRTRALTIGLFTTGVALKFGSVFVANSAQDTYGQYLSTGIQADIAKYRDDYQTQRNLSLGMSRTAIGFVGLALFISICDQLDFISESSSSHSPQLSLKPSYNPRTGEAALSLQRKF